MELGVSDALREPEPTLSPDSLAQLRTDFLFGKEGLRHINEATILERLVDASITYHDDPGKNDRPSVQLYSELFTKILYPPSRVTDPDDPYSLQVQIEELINILGAKDVWFDFSLIEWRIRLGQILWGPPIDLENEVEVNSVIFQQQNTHRYWLLAQLLLSCELLLRLDAISVNSDHAPNPSEISRFDKLATIPIRWSIILARQWLESISIIVPKRPVVENKPATGWLATLTGGTAAMNVNSRQPSVEDVQFKGRHQERQLKGLYRFAAKLKWPELDALAAKVSSNGVTILDSGQSTPAVGTPLSNGRSNSYFSSRSGVSKGGSRSRAISALIHPSGWLSNSYISGLILPGEGISHFLISTLLENDSIALSKLGPEANLYGGFMYENRSFWSAACVVGRVLAAGKGASECMGWIASAVVHTDSEDYWVDIKVEQLSDCE